MEENIFPAAQEGIEIYSRLSLLHNVVQSIIFSDDKNVLQVHSQMW